MTPTLWVCRFLENGARLCGITAKSLEEAEAAVSYRYLPSLPSGAPSVTSKDRLRHYGLIVEPCEAVASCQVCGKPVTGRPGDPKIVTPAGILCLACRGSEYEHREENFGP